MKLVKLKVWHTDNDDKYIAQDILEYLCDQKSAILLYLWLTHGLKFKHVEICALDGDKQQPEDGICGISY